MNQNIYHSNNQIAYRASDGMAFHSNNQVAYRRNDGWAFHHNNQVAYRSDGLSINENNQVLSRNGEGLEVALGPGIKMFVGRNIFKLWVKGSLVVSK